MCGFIKLKRGKETEELMKYPPAFMLLSQIAFRAKRTDDFSINNLEIGEALVGDYKQIGLTLQTYRSAKSKLTKRGFITTRATNKGTIAKIVNKLVYDINENENNKQDNKQITNQQQTNNKQITSNKNIKNIKNERKDNSEIFFETFRKYYPKKKGKGKSKQIFLTIVKKGEAPEKIIEGVKNYIKEHDFLKRNKMFCPEYKHPTTRLNQKCWEDDYTTELGEGPDFDTIYQCFKDGGFNITAIKERFPDFYKEKYTKEYRQRIIKRMHTDRDFFGF